MSDGSDDKVTESLSMNSCYLRLRYALQKEMHCDEDDCGERKGKGSGVSGRQRGWRTGMRRRGKQPLKLSPYSKYKHYMETNT